MSTREITQRAGKYLTFVLDGEKYALDAMRVVAIIGNQPITPLPQAPGYVRGLTMVRGKVVPVVDARTRLGMPAAEASEETCIVLLTVGTGQTGIQVDSIHDVSDISDDKFDDVGGGVGASELFRGIAKLTEGIVTILNVDEVVKFAAVR